MKFGSKPAFAKSLGKAKKVFVGMSGGVDSSVSAALLQKAGYDVTGVFIKVWSPDWLPCEWKEERRDAMRVAAHLNIPFVTLDLEAEYKKEVADYMIEEYKKGNTPNPDVMCNKEIKFGSFLDKALEMGADYIATGHYAVNFKETKNSSATIFTLKESVDKNKDQSYFLWTLTQKQLKHVLFPVGNLVKQDVRKLAAKFKLPVAEKKDSQGICFIGKVEMKEFLQHYIDIKPGNVLTEEGNIIGTHEGVVFYTVGQRHGFDITVKSATDTGYYVVKKDVANNNLIVSQKKSEDALKVAKEVGLDTNTVNWIAGITPDASKTYLARVRYRQEPQKCKIGLANDEVKIYFEQGQQGVSVGQSVVLYDEETCLGGGIIKEVN